jgi:hypothetical protein
MVSEHREGSVLSGNRERGEMVCRLVWLPLIGILAAVAAGCGSATPKAESSGTSAPPSSTGAPPSSTAAPSGTSALRSGASGPSLDAIVLGTWRNGVALDEATVAIDVVVTEDAVRIQADKDLQSACGQLIPDVRTLQQDPGAPDPSTNSLWQQALSDLAKGGSECYNAAAAQNATELNSADNDIVSGSSNMTSVTNKVASEVSGPPGINFNSSSPLSSADSQALPPRLNLVSNDQSSIGVDLSSTVAGAAAQDFDAWQAGCTTLANDVKTLQHDPSPPVASTSQLWQQSLSLYAKGATECVAGTTVPEDLNKLHESNIDIGNANNDMIEVGIEALGA